MRIFLIPLSITFLNPKILGFHFSTKKSLAVGEKCEKLNFKNSLRNLLDKLRRLYMHEWNDHLEIFSCPQVIENSNQHLFLRTDILQKKVVGCPCFSLTIVEKNNGLYFATITVRVKGLDFKYLTWKNSTIMTGNVGCFIHVGWTRVMCLPNNSHLLRTVEIPIPILALICS